VRAQQSIIKSSSLSKNIVAGKKNSQFKHSDIIFTKINQHLEKL